MAIICSANIGGTNDKPLDFQWIGPTGAVMSSSGRIHVENVTTIQNQGLTFYTSTLTFSTLSSQDNNSMYQCSVGTLYTPYFTQYTPSSSMTTVVVSGMFPTPCVCWVLSHWSSPSPDPQPNHQWSLLSAGSPSAQLYRCHTSVCCPPCGVLLVQRQWGDIRPPGSWGSWHKCDPSRGQCEHADHSRVLCGW